ncbi:histone chaperone rttp106 family protein [Acanthamoeba castellanii str. Neff]|uniref:Histone chaperone rttp106 family protein n=1 Tax=Acanthamoeba castellanii (strain ATCC 30010 / Neff) TaxID=1257118 RepID=L8HMH1_ACACF|nr:histone chaperone rttp106 family protein [Acanthamoeba castellanii str. Neff]ELR25576.1 histone chaperone rttp106 family protein [Acanthamoeba castellanii str. Neff]
MQEDGGNASCNAIDLDLNEAGEEPEVAKPREEARAGESADVLDASSGLDLNQESPSPPPPKIEIKIEPAAEPPTVVPGSPTPGQADADAEERRLRELLLDGVSKSEAPPTYIRYSDITVVEFARVSSEKQGDIQGGSRTFDLVVYTKGGNDVQFTGMQRTEFKALVNFIQSKGIKIKRISHMEAGADTSGAEADLVASSGAVDDGSSSEDDDFIAKDEMEPDEEFDEGDAEALEADEVDEVDDTSGRGKRKREEAEAKPKPKGERETQTKKGRLRHGRMSD